MKPRRKSWLRTPGLYVVAIRAGLLSVAEADADKARLDACRFNMGFSSFGNTTARSREKVYNLENFGVLPMSGWATSQRISWRAATRSWRRQPRF